MELLHNASLMIDDIQDGSVERRGRPCSHMVYGADNAISSANLMYFLPVHKLTQSLGSVELKWKVAEVYLREMAVPGIRPSDGRRIEILATGLPLW